MNSTLELAIASVQKANKAFCKFISANDAGKTGGHQSGFYIPKNSVELMFDTPGLKGVNKDRFITIRWQNDFETNSRFIYYGTGTRNEYRLTRFGKGFPFLFDDNVGDLLILCYLENDFYEGFVLSSDEDIDDFLAAFSLSATETNQLIPRNTYVTADQRLLQCYGSFIQTLNKKFPSTDSLSNAARNCYNSSYNIDKSAIVSNPDSYILKWIESEYELFKAIENELYSELIKSPFKSVEEFVNSANTVLNRRKSRAGKSLEYHLAEVFDCFNLEYSPQAITEGNKKPDFIFPNIDSYHNHGFDSDKLVFLASKTTCKDRWRQVINEADRVRTKHLFTLQQGISKNQLSEMYSEEVCLVVPKAYLNSFPLEYRKKILTLESFINYSKSKQLSV